MTKRIREPIEVTTRDEPSSNPCAPVDFAWRGSRYQVVGVIGHWREDAGWWVAAGTEVTQRDLWRVEARNGRPEHGVYELVCEAGAWRLERVWD